MEYTMLKDGHNIIQTRRRSRHICIYIFKIFRKPYVLTFDKLPIPVNDIALTFIVKVAKLRHKWSSYWKLHRQHLQ